MTRAGPSELGVIMAKGGRIRRPAPPPSRSQCTGNAVAESAIRALESHIFIKGLRVDAEIGVYAHEQGRLRPLLLDLDVTLASDKVSDSDDLADTVDYDDLAAHVQEVAKSGHIQLIETFAEMVCARILSDARIGQVRLRLEKPDCIAGAICSGVEIVRTRA